MTRTASSINAHVRWMIRRDLPDVLGVEAVSFASPWSEDEFLGTLRQRNCIPMVAECGDRVVGFMVYELHKARLEVLNFAVGPEHRRRDIGSQMVRKLKSKLSTHRRRQVTATVRETNAAALGFFRGHGFLATKLLRGHYDDTGEDGIRLAFTDPTVGTDEVAVVHNRIATYPGE